MSMTFVHSALRAAVAKICLDVGWHASYSTSLNVLVDILDNYLKALSKKVLEAANHAGRTEPTMEDIAYVFKKMPIDLNQLKDYILNVESSPLDFEIIDFPIKNQSNRILNNFNPNEERPEYYYEWLPSLNCSEIKTESDLQAPISVQQDNNDNQKQQSSSDSIEKPIEQEIQQEIASSNVDDDKVEKPVEDSEKVEDNIIKDIEMKSIQNDENEQQQQQQQQQETTPMALDEDAKTKLVFKFSLGKSLEENTTDLNKVDKKITLSQSTSALDVLNHLKSSKAYLRTFQNLSIFDNIENRQNLRTADCQRLPNEHKSRENSPEPEPETNNSDSTMLNNNNTTNPNNNNNVLTTINNNDLDDINLKKLFGNKKKSRAKVTNPIPDNIGDGPLEFSIKVKEIGNSNKKERPKKENAEGKPSRPKKVKDKPLSIKVTGFGLSTSNENKPSPTATAIPNDLSNETTFESLNDSMNNNSSTTIISNNNNTPTDTPEKTPAKKRIYKRKEKLKDSGGGGGDGEPKPKKMKKSKLDSTQQKQQQFDFEQSESTSTPVTTSVSGKIKKNKKQKVMDTSKSSSLNMTESNDLKKDFDKLNDSSFNQNINMDNGLDVSNLTGTGATAATPTKSSTKNKSGSNRSSNNNSNNKRSKSVNSKKAVSAEIVESSGDSSSDDEMIDKNPVSLLVNPEQFDDEKMFGDNLKHHPSNSSLNLNKQQSSPPPSFIDDDDYQTNLDEQTTSSRHIPQIIEEQNGNKKSNNIEEDNISSSKDSSSTSTIKHKKNKKHSKNKHHRHGDEKSHKKHKKSKDKDKNKDKEDKSSKNKNKEKKDFKPKLNIKFNVPDDSSIIDDKTDVKMPPQPLVADEVNFDPSPSSKEKVKLKYDSGTNKKKSSKSTGNNKQEIESITDNKNELIFIKDTSNTTKSKESKSKKNKIINVGDSLLEEQTPLPPTKIFASNEKSSKLSFKEDKKVKTYEIPIKSPSSIISIGSKSSKSKKKESKQEIVIANEECIVSRETIKIESNVPEQFWTCPACNGPDNGSPMIGCDSCDYWYHYTCVGIVEEPNEDEPWFCDSCLKKKEQEAKQEKRKQELINKKDKKKKEKQQTTTSLLASNSKTTTRINSKNDDERDIVTITPIPPTPTAIPGIKLPSSVSIYSIPPNESSTSQMYSSLETPKSSRPRGRPRKDSTTSNSGSSITITPIAGPSSSSSSGINKSGKIGKKSSQSFTSSQSQSQRRHHQNLDINSGASTSKSSMKETCPVCKSVEGPGEAFDMIKCDNCFQWYHWQCVGISSTPSPDSSWFCNKCKKKKFNKRLWNAADDDDDEFNMDSNDNLQQQNYDDDDDKNEISWEEPSRCVSCKPDRIPEDSEWICCDFCNNWYHFICEKVEEKPGKNENWFCSSCVRKQKAIFRTKILQERK